MAFPIVKLWRPGWPSIPHDRRLRLCQPKRGRGQDDHGRQCGRNLARGRPSCAPDRYRSPGKRHEQRRIAAPELAHSIYNALIDGVPLSTVIRPTNRPRLSLAPSSPSLAGAEVEMVAMEGREYLLANTLEAVAAHFDYILIDSPPSLGLLTLNGLTAARDGVIIPVQCEYLALEGLTRLLQTVQLAHERLNPGLKVAGLVMTMYDARTNLSQQVVEEVRQHFPQQVFETVIPRNVRLSEAPSYGEPIITYAPGSSGAIAYAALAQEIASRSQKRSSPPVTKMPAELPERGIP